MKTEGRHASLFGRKKEKKGEKLEVVGDEVFDLGKAAKKEKEKEAKKAEKEKKEKKEKTKSKDVNPIAKEEKEKGIISPRRSVWKK